jgi:hypothetical protein
MLSCTIISRFAITYTSQAVTVHPHCGGVAHRSCFTLMFIMKSIYQINLRIMVCTVGPRIA